MRSLGIIASVGEPWDHWGMLWAYFFNTHILSYLRILDWNGQSLEKLWQFNNWCQNVILPRIWYLDSPTFFCATKCVLIWEKIIQWLSQLKCVTIRSHTCSIMYKQPIELSLVKVELLSKTFLHWVTLNSNLH